MEQPADPERIREFSAAMPGGLHAFVDLFITHTRSLPADVRGAVAAGDPKALRDIAHRSIGSTSACGATRLAEILRELERAGKAGRLDGLDGLLADLDAELAQLHQFLRCLSKSLIPNP